MNEWLKIGDDRIDLSKVIYVRHDRREKLVLVVQDGSDGSVWVKGDEASAEFLAAFDAYHGIGQPDAVATEQPVNWIGRRVSFTDPPRVYFDVYDQFTNELGELRIKVAIPSDFSKKDAWKLTSAVVDWSKREVWILASAVTSWLPAAEPAQDDKDAEIARLRKENERLLVTLKPFAELYDGYDIEEIEAFPDFYDYVDSVIRGDSMVNDFLYASVEYRKAKS